MTAAFTVQMAFGTVPTPLWPLYEQRDGFDTTMVTVAYAVTVGAAAVGFLLLGHLSDRFGRRRVVVPALLTAFAAALCLMLFPELPGLIVGRLLTGLGVGLMASTATTYLTDLYHAKHPDRRGSAAPGLIATAANLGGLALGPLLAGVVAEWAPAPLVTPYLLFAVAFVVLTVLVLASPETVDRNLVPDTASRFALRPGGRWSFSCAAAVGFFSYAVMGLFSSLGAVMIRSVLGITSLAVAGIAPFAMFAASAVAQLAFGRLTTRRMLLTGLVIFPVGLGLSALALFEPALWLYLTAAAIAGAGAGLLFKGALGQSMGSAEHHSRAGVLALFFAIAYIGMGAPSIAFSVAAQQVGLRVSMIAFAAVLSLGTAVAVALSAPRMGRSLPDL
jgi:MFS family permease